MHVEIRDGEFYVEASLLGELLGLSPPRVQALMRSEEITSRCERGEGDDEGRYRLSFFYGARRLQFDVDASGRILRSTTMDFHELSSRAKRARRGAVAPGVPPSIERRAAPPNGLGEPGTMPPLWRLHAVAHPGDPHWQGRRIWTEVVVRARSAAFARLIASKLEEPPVPGVLGNETHCFRSGFEDEKLYWVRRLSPAEAAPYEKRDKGDAVIMAVPLSDASGRPPVPTERNQPPAGSLSPAVDRPLGPPGLACPAPSSKAAHPAAFAPIRRLRERRFAIASLRA